MDILLLVNSYSALISGLLMIVLGVFVFWKNIQKKLNIIFLVFCVAMSNWLLSTHMMYVSGCEKDIIFWDRMVYVGVVFVPVLMYHFGLIFTRREIKNKFKLLFGYFLSFLFLVLSRTDNFISGLYYYEWGYHTQAGIFHHLFLVFYSAYIFLFLFEIYRYLFLKCRDNFGTNNEKENIKSVKFLFVAFIILNLGAYAFLPAYNLNINPIGAYWAEIVAVTIIALAILKYHLFDVRVILTEILVGLMGIILATQFFLMPTTVLKIISAGVLILFSFFGYCLIRTTLKESKRREEAELVAARERELRGEAERLAEDLRRIDAAKTQFLLSTQHHLRSPLSVVQGYLSMINEGDYGRISAKAKEKIGTSLKETQKLIRLINDLLDVAHFQMNKEMAAKEPADVVGLVSEVIADLKKNAAEKKIYLRFKKPNAPTPLINIDIHGIREAIYNIVDNAIKYTDRGGVLVSMSVCDNCLRVSVADSGIGMDEKEQQDLFERVFERGTKAKNVNINGKGIGLYLAAQMIKTNGGEIRVESEGWGKGSTFIIKLPMDDREPAQTGK